MSVKILFLLLCAATVARAQKTAIHSPASFFPKERPRILVVGAFHFDYPNLDVIKTNDEDKIDVLREPKRSEVTELVQYIERFRPTKIVIEAEAGWKATEKLKAYLNGAFQNERDERFQLGMRIARDMKLDTIYALDANSMTKTLAKHDSVYLAQLFKDFDFQSSDPCNDMMKRWYEYDGRLVRKMSLLKYFKHLNSREHHRYDYGAYLVGDFKLDNDRGADILSIWWYNRNLRIFRKIQELQATKDDRVLVIFGNGHAAVLRQLLECSPEYEFVEFGSLK